MVRAVASEDEEPGRSVLSCASLQGLPGTWLYQSLQVLHLLFSSGPVCSQSLNWHICFSHCPASQPICTSCVTFAWVMAGMEEANYRKTKPNGHANHCPKHGVTTWRWYRNNGREPHRAWGWKEWWRFQPHLTAPALRPLFHGYQDLLFLKIKYWPWFLIHQYCDLSSRWSQVCQLTSTSCFPCSNPGHRLDHRDGLGVASSFDICSWSVPTACVSFRSWLSSVTSEVLQEKSVLQKSLTPTFSSLRNISACGYPVPKFWDSPGCWETCCPPHPPQHIMAMLLQSKRQMKQCKKERVTAEMSER